MPPYPGEDRVVTLYADIHYYFAQPTIRPLMHRFDKGSYFYVYYNSTRQTTRLEVANNPGTPEQDAFNGYLDKCRITNTYKFPTLFTVLVDPTDPTHTPGSPRSGRDANEWRLASSDPRDQGKHMYRLHTVDFYFWAQEDTKQVIEVLRKYLHPSQLDIVDLDPTSQEQQQHEEVHPVVQNLEHVAISDPEYRDGKTRNSQNQPQSQGGANLPPPPPPPLQQPTHSPSSVSDDNRLKANKSQSSAPGFTPMPYNPAAPPAPEPIAHREDTPPPEDGTGGTGLSAAARQDQPYTPGPYTAAAGPVPNIYGHPGSPPPPNSTYGAMPPQSAPAHQQQYHPSITSSTTLVPTFSGPPLASTLSNASVTTAPTALSPQQSQTTMPSRHASIAEQRYSPHNLPQYTPQQQPVQAVETPGTQFYPTHHASVSHIQPQYPDYLAARPQSQQPGAPAVGAPLGGYSNYAYDPAQSVQQGQFMHQRPSEVHTQLYRPTEHEQSHAHGGHKPSKSSSGGGGGAAGQQSKLDSGVERVEKKAGKLWKKIQNF